MSETLDDAARVMASCRAVLAGRRRLHHRKQLARHDRRHPLTSPRFHPKRIITQRAATRVRPADDAMG